MISLLITETAKGCGSKEKWVGIGEFERKFNSIKKAKEWLKEYYGKCKRSKMYMDKEDGNHFHCGYIYHFHNDDISHVPVEKWIQNDRVTFREIKTINLAIL